MEAWKFKLCDKIASFCKKRWHPCDWNFHISFTCKNDPGPPSYRLNDAEDDSYDHGNDEKDTDNYADKNHDNVDGHIKTVMKLIVMKLMLMVIMVMMMLITILTTKMLMLIILIDMMIQMTEVMLLRLVMMKKMLLMMMMWMLMTRLMIIIR